MNNQLKAAKADVEALKQKLTNKIDDTPDQEQLV